MPQNKLASSDQPDQMNNEVEDVQLEPADKHTSFIRKGPLRIDPSLNCSACSLSLYIAQEDDQDFGLASDQLKIFSSSNGLYPYNVYDIQDTDIDKTANRTSDMGINFV